MAGNPFSLSNIHGIKSTVQDLLETNLRNKDEESINAEVNLQTENSYSDDDDTSSVSSISYTD